MPAVIVDPPRIEDVMISQRRDYATGELRTVISLYALRESHDADTGAWAPIDHVAPTLGTWDDVTNFVNTSLVQLAAERDALLSEKTELVADRDAATLALASKEDERAALQAQLDALNAPATVRRVISQRFKIALFQLDLLTEAEALVANAPVPTQLYWQYPEFYENDALLAQMATLLATFTSKTVPPLSAVFDLALTIP